MEVVGSFYELDGVLYVVVNSNGTVEKLNKAPWWRVLALYILQYFGKVHTVEEVKKFLYH